MSVLTRHPTVPEQRVAEREAPVRQPGAPGPRVSRGRRSVLLVAGGAVLLAGGVGTAAYLLNDDSPAAPSTSVDLPYDSEAKRDAAAAARHDDGSTAISEAKRDAAAASRYESAAK